MNGLKEMKILIVDDREANVRMVEALLRRMGYSAIRCLTDATRTIAAYREFGPDIILLDLHMPGLDGYGVLEQLKTAVPASEYLPVLVLTADVTREARERALALGARDFLQKPIDTTEVMLRIRNLLETRMLHQEQRRQNEQLEQKVKARTQELELARLETMERLALASDFRDDATGKHARRVGEMSALLARELGLSGELAELYGLAAPLHDVGKIGVPDDILRKPGKLTAEEFEAMKRHTGIGGLILSGSHSPVLQLAETIALSHHERWDGLGYHLGLKGEEIPLGGRVVSVADVFDALTHERPYKPAWPVGQALDELRALSGTSFDPQVTAAFIGLVESGRITSAEASPVA